MLRRRMMMQLGQWSTTCSDNRTMSGSKLERKFIALKKREKSRAKRELVEEAYGIGEAEKKEWGGYLKANGLHGKLPARSNRKFFRALNGGSTGAAYKGSGGISAKFLAGRKKAHIAERQAYTLRRAEQEEIGHINSVIKLRQSQPGWEKDKEFMQYKRKYAEALVNFNKRWHGSAPKVATNQPVAQTARGDSKTLVAMPKLRKSASFSVGVPRNLRGSIPGQERGLQYYADLYRQYTGRDAYRDASAAGKKVYEFVKNWMSKEQHVEQSKPFEVQLRNQGASTGGGNFSGRGAGAVMMSHKINNPIAATARQVMMSAPNAISMAAPQMGFSTMAGTRFGRDGITIKGCDYLGILTADSAAGTGSGQAAGSYLLNLDLNPSVLGIQRITYLAAMFEMFHFEYFNIYYAPGCGADTDGSMVFYTETDPDDQLSDDLGVRIKQAFGHAGAATSSYWTPAMFKVICKGGKFYVDAGEEERLTTQAHINCLVNIASTSSPKGTGVWFCEYELALYRSRTDGPSGVGGNFWGVYVQNTTATVQIYPLAPGLVQGVGQQLQVMPGSNLQVSVAAVKEAYFGADASRITVLNSGNQPYLITISSYGGNNNVAQCPGLGITNVQPSYVDNGTVFGGDWQTVGEMCGGLINAVGTATAFAVKAAVGGSFGPGQTATAQLQPFTTSTSSTYNQNQYQVVIWPNTSEGSAAQIGDSFSFDVFWSSAVYNGQNHGSGATPNVISCGIIFGLLVQPINASVAMASYKRLARKSAQMMAKMKSLKDEVEAMATQIEQKRDEIERKRQQDAGELSLGGQKEKDPGDKGDAKSEAKEELTPSEAEWVQEQIDGDDEYIFSHGFNTCYPWTGNPTTDRIDLSTAVTAGTDLGKPVDIEECHRAKEDLKRMQELMDSAASAKRVPTPERKGPGYKANEAQKIAMANIAAAIADEAAGRPVQSRKDRIEQLKCLIKDRARKREDRTPEQRDIRILAWKAELAKLEGDPRIDNDGLPPEHELAHAGKGSSKKGTS